MNGLSADLTDLSLNLDDVTAVLGESCFDEETWLIPPPPSLDGCKKSGRNGVDENATTDFSKTPRANTEDDEDEDLAKWLEGAIRKVDFRTRSALSRRLDKKRRKREKRERLILCNDNVLTKIDEAHRGTLNGEVFGSDETLDDDIDVDDEEDEAFYDVAEPIDETRSAGELYRTPKTHRVDNKTASLRDNATLSTLGRRCVSISVDNRRYARSDCGSTPGGGRVTRTGNDNEEHLNLSELERRAKEQEQELQMELKNRRAKIRAGQNSRPNSASSSASSSAANVMITSRSVDFHATRANSTVSTGDCSNFVSLTQANETGSATKLNRLAESRTPTLNSRLPMPRRPVVGGKTGIPLPTPKSVKMLGTNANQHQLNSSHTANVRSQDSSECALPSLLDADDDCF